VRLETATEGPLHAELDCLDAERTSKKKRNGQEEKAEKTAPPFLPKLPGYSIHDVTGMTVIRARQFFENLKLGAEGTLVAEPIAKEIKNRLTFLLDVGLGYLTLDRKTGSLSGGEAQRIRLATQVGSGLVGCVMCSMSRRSGCISATTRADSHAAAADGSWQHGDHCRGMMRTAFARPTI